MHLNCRLRQALFRGVNMTKLTEAANIMVNNYWGVSLITANSNLIVIKEEQGVFFTASQNYQPSTLMVGSMKFKLQFRQRKVGIHQRKLFTFRWQHRVFPRPPSSSGRNVNFLRNKGKRPRVHSLIARHFPV